MDASNRISPTTDPQIPFVLETERLNEVHALLEKGDELATAAKSAIGITPEVEKKRRQAQAIRLNLLSTILDPLKLPHAAMEVPVKDLIILLLGEYWKEIEKSVIDEKGKMAFFSFMDYVHRNPGAKSNAARFQSLLIYLQPFMAEKEAQPKELKQAITFLMQSEDLPNTSIRKLLSQPSQAATVCQYLCPQLEMLSVQVFDLLSTQLKALNPRLNFKTNLSAKSLGLVVNFNLADKLNKTFHLLQARQALFREQILEVSELLATPFPSHVKLAREIITQLKRTSSIIESLIQSCETELYKPTCGLKDCLGKERITKIEEQAKTTQAFCEDKTEEEASQLGQESGRTLIETAHSNIALNALTHLDHDPRLAEAAAGMQAFYLQQLQLLKSFSQIGEAVKKVVQNAEKRQEETSRQFLDDMRKKRTPENQQKKVFEYLENLYRLLLGAQNYFGTLKKSASMLNHFASLIESKIPEIPLLDPQAHDAYADVVVKEKSQVIRKKKKPSSSLQEAPVEVVPESPNVRVEPAVEAAPLSYGQAKAFLLSLTKAPVDIDEEALPYQADLKLHATLYLQSIDLLKTCKERGALPFIFTRLGACMTENVLTTRLLQMQDEVSLDHSILFLSRQLGIQGEPRFKPFLEQIDQGVVSHRYPHLCQNPCVYFDKNLENRLLAPLQFLQWMVLGTESGEVEGAVEGALKAAPKKSAYPHKETIDLWIEPASKKVNNLVRLLEGIKPPSYLQEDPVERGNWMNIIEHAQGIKNLFVLMREVPKVKFLALYGDILLTHLQFLDEQIERALYCREMGGFIKNHDLRKYREWRAADCTEAEWSAVDALNIDKYAQYPHLAKKDGVQADAVKWRLEAHQLCLQPKLDAALADEQKNLKKGFEAVSPRLKQTEDLLDRLGSMSRPILQSAIERIGSFAN